mgnify:CR=1 FL=1
MPNTVIFTPQLTRRISHFKKYDIEVPKKLLEKHSKRPDLSGFPYPLPCRKSSNLETGIDEQAFYMI